MSLSVCSSKVNCSLPITQLCLSLVYFATSSRMKSNIAVISLLLLGALRPTPCAHSFLRRPAAVHVCRAASKKPFWRLPVEGWRNLSTMAKKRPLLLSVKASETTSPMTADGKLASTIFLVFNCLLQIKCSDSCTESFWLART